MNCALVQRRKCSDDIHEVIGLVCKDIWRKPNCDLIHYIAKHASMDFILKSKLVMLLRKQGLKLTVATCKMQVDFFSACEFMSVSAAAALQFIYV